VIQAIGFGWMDSLICFFPQPLTTLKRSYPRWFDIFATN